MTAEPRLLAALAAALRPDLAAAALARALDPRCAVEGARLAAAAPADRLEALAVALDCARPSPRSAEAAAAAERPRLAALIRHLAAGAPPETGTSPALLRLLRERLVA